MLKALFDTKNEARRVSKVYFCFENILMLICGGLFGCIFNHQSLSYFAFIGVIPLYLIVQNKSVVKSFITAFFWGYGWAIVSFFWLGQIEPFIPFVMAIVLGFFPGIWASFFPIIKNNILLPNDIILSGYSKSQKYIVENKLHYRRIIMIVIISGLWSILDWIRSWIFTGLPWNYLSVTQWNNPHFTQIASITGIYGITFMIVFFNFALGEVILSIFRSLKHKVKIRIPFCLYLAIILIILNYIFGIYSIESLTKQELKKKPSDLKVLVAQGDIPQMRFCTSDQAMFALNTYYNITEKALIEEKVKPNLIIWPETAVPVPLFGDGYLSSEYRKKIDKLISTYHVPILVGTLNFGDIQSENNFKMYSSAILISKDGNVVDKYNKMHLVPWGEYTPGEHLFPFKYFYPWIKKTFGMGRSLTPGRRNTIFNLGNNIYTGVLICFDDVFPQISRDHKLFGANLLIIITNDAWYSFQSHEPTQHLVESIFRAIENRVTIIRSGNNNGTCVISPTGQIIDSIFKESIDGKKILDPFKVGKGVAFFNVKINTDLSQSFYTKYGDVFIYLLIAVFLSALTYIFWQWKDRKQRLINIIKEDDIPCEVNEKFR